MIVKESTPILAWHFCSLDPVRGPVLLTYDGSKPLTVAPGYVYTTDEPRLVLCTAGLHGSRCPLTALQYAPGPILCRTAHWGEVIEGTDKLVSRHREVLWMRDVSNELRLFACWCARQVWDLLTDERSRTAIEVAERFAHGEATVEELDAARIAAWDVVGSAARTAARDAARAAARAAARIAAWDAARIAAWDVVGSAAWVSAWTAAWTAQCVEWNRIVATLYDGR